jgi:pimeloyl-ACP methyl ester carboxylesterase
MDEPMLRCFLMLAAMTATASPVPTEERTLVMVADGAGDFRGLSTALRRAVQELDLPLEIEPAAWSHGYRRVIADQCDRAHIWAEGRRLADRIVAARTACPTRPVYLMAHSAGNALALATAHFLPPDSVERVVLLAPTTPAHADLRPALRAARQGVDVFYSCRDRMGPLAGLSFIGRDGRLFCRVAARHGFILPAVAPGDDAPLYRKLRQFGWGPGLICTDHEGDHYGIYQPGFLRSHVLPLLFPPPGGPAQ